MQCKTSRSASAAYFTALCFHITSLYFPQTRLTDVHHRYAHIRLRISSTFSSAPKNISATTRSYSPPENYCVPGVWWFQPRARRVNTERKGSQVSSARLKWAQFELIGNKTPEERCKGQSPGVVGKGINSYRWISKDKGNNLNLCSPNLGENPLFFAFA